MEKLSFADLVLLAKSMYVDYDKLLMQGPGGLVSSSGFSFVPNSDAGISAESASDINYDRLSVLIKILSCIEEYRPLPF